jgi:hypothetical protein
MSIHTTQVDAIRSALNEDADTVVQVYGNPTPETAAEFSAQMADCDSPTPSRIRCHRDAVKFALGVHKCLRCGERTDEDLSS